MSHSEEKQTKNVSRREALKLMLAMSGAAVLSTVPNRWDKPLVEIGALPAFAQCSPTCGGPTTISNLTVSDRLGNCGPISGQPGDLYSATLSFVEPGGPPSCGLESELASLRAVFNFLPSQTTQVDDIVLTAVNLSGNPEQGTITVPVCITFGNSDSVDLTISVINKSCQPGNELTVNIANPSTQASDGGQPFGQLKRN